MAGCSTNPNGAWLTQQARNVGLDFADQGMRLLIRDRDSKYTGSFDEVFRSAGIRVVKTPMRAPQANAIAERFVRTARAECLDWLLILNRRHLERVLRVSVEHYNTQRSHRALNLRPPQPREPPPTPTPTVGRSVAATASAALSTSTTEPRPEHDTNIGTLQGRSRSVPGSIIRNGPQVGVTELDGELRAVVRRTSLPLAPACHVQRSSSRGSGLGLPIQRHRGCVGLLRARRRARAAEGEHPLPTRLWH